MALRKSITIDEDDFLTISRHCKKIGKTLSEFLRDTALDVIAQSERIDLYDYLIKTVPFVSDEEQVEFETLALDFESQGRELSVDDIL